MGRFGSRSMLELEPLKRMWNQFLGSGTGIRIIYGMGLDLDLDPGLDRE